MKFKPQTKLGMWSVGLIISVPILVFFGTFFMNLLYKNAPAGNTITEDLTNRPALALAMLAGMISGVGALITGLVAIIRNKEERSVLVIIATVLGGLLLFFLLGEVIFPH